MTEKNTTIKVTKTIQEELQALRRENETYSSIIRRLLDERKTYNARIDELMSLNLEKSNIIASLKQKQREEIVNKFNEMSKDEQMTYMVIMKITTDIVPSTHERVIKLCENAYLQDLIKQDKKDMIFKACELVKEEIKLGHEDFYNQLQIIDSFVMMVKTGLSFEDENVEDDEI